MQINAVEFIRCLIRGLKLSVRHGAWIDGHEWVEVIDNDRQQILQCERCGHVSRGWKCRN